MSPRNDAVRTTKSLRQVYLAEVVNFDSKAKRHVIDELELLLEEARQGQLVGFSYAATSAANRNIVGVAGTQRDADKAIASLFRAAVSLLIVELLAPM